jgi:hypothetical protein
MPIPDISQRKLTHRSMPPGAIIPELVYEDVERAAAWLGQAFGFRERLTFSQAIADVDPRTWVGEPHEAA